ncbi:MAG: penicillin-binding transpeptidase domain-containing protein, partial [Oscillospiraceae bacterium]|nr:penicillin-binding transpeptidase domain-containing protein [Oscillospiraceae bacterium]
YYAPEPELADSIDIPEAYLNAVKSGMRSVIELGTAASLFNGLSVSVGGKTGTAQVHIGQSSETGTFVAFAPYSAPEISMSVVIEKGSKGTWAGYVAEDVLAYYFGDKSFEQSMDMPEPEEIEEGEEIGEEGGEYANE